MDTAQLLSAVGRVQRMLKGTKAGRVLPWATLLAGIGLAAASILRLFSDPQTAVFAIIIMLGLIAVAVVVLVLATMGGTAVQILALIFGYAAVLLVITSAFLLMTSYFFRWPRILAPPGPDDTGRLLGLIDAARDGNQMSDAIHEARLSSSAGALIERLKELAHPGDRRRLAALFLLAGPDTKEICALFQESSNRQLQTEVLATIAEIKPVESPDLEPWFLTALEHTDDISMDTGYCLGLCLGMAYDWSNPRRRTPPDRGFWEEVRKNYENHPDPGIHGLLRFLLLNDGSVELDQLDRTLAAKKGEQSVIDQLKKNERGKREGPAWYVTPSGLTMIVIPPGGFRVSVPEGWKGDISSPIPVNAQGQVDHWFAVSSLEVSNAQFSHYVNQLRQESRAEVLKPRNTYKGKIEAWIESPALPATRVSFFYAMDYCRWLTDLENGRDGNGKTSTRSKRFTENERNLDAKRSIAYRLPLEEEWEYACRAGSSTSCFFGEDKEFLNVFAWFGARVEEAETGEAVPRPVGSKLPNRWGLFDLYANAEEWCMNTWRDDFTSDLSGIWTPYRGTPSSGLFERPLRGGNCAGSGESLFSSYRQKTPEQRNQAPKYAGFRVARTFFLSVGNP